MNQTNSLVRPSQRSLSAAWQALRNFVRWFASLIMPTEQDFREAGVYFGKMRA
jgi:hypothetical protein